MGTHVASPTPAVAPGIEAAAVSRFFAERVPGGDVPLSFALVGDGRSNVTVLVTGGGRRWVLRRPPLGHVLPTAHDMAREHRVLTALAGSDVPVPRPLALCEDPAVTGAPFYVMEHREGVVVGDRLPPGFATTPDERRRLSLALVETLARLHAVDVEGAGLADFGRPAGYLERQVRRWAQQWERSKVEEAPAIEELARRLRASLPDSPAPTVVHGDYRLGNVALAADDPGRVVAVFDWEMATLGDPLADLGYLLVYWGDPEDPPQARAPGSFQAVTAQEGFLRRSELAQAYAERTGRDASGIAWYEVLALYKLAVISEGIYARWLQGKTVGEGFAGLRRQSVPLAQRALALANASPLPALRGEVP